MFHRPFQDAVRNAVGTRCGAFSGNMKVSVQAARSIGFSMDLSYTSSAQNNIAAVSAGGRTV
jgi:hypothetical protein